MMTPISIQIGNIIALDVSCLSEYIINPVHEITPKIGNNGTNGTLKGLFKFGSVFLKIITATQIAIKAVNVP